MDLSKLSVEDLQAIAAGDMSKVSAEGLRLLAGQSAAAPPGYQDEATAESQRHLNRQTGFATQATPTLTVAQQKQKQYDDIKQQIAQFERQARELQVQNPGGMNPELSQAEAEVRSYITELQKQLPPDRASQGGMIGGIVGGAAGAFAPFPGGVAVGNIIGGAIGNVIGGLVDAKREGMTEDEKLAYLKKRGIEQVAFDSAGNLLFYGGGRLIRTISKSEAAAYDAAVKALGGEKSLIGSGLNAPREAILPGQRVFNTTKPEGLQQLAERGVQAISDENATVTAGSLRGEAGFGESVARAKDPAHFAINDLKLSDRVTGKVKQVIDRFRGQGGKAEFSGEELTGALQDLEDATKRTLKPVWEELASMRGKGAETVDIRELNDFARRALAENAKAKIKVLDGEKLDWLRKFAGQTAPAEKGNFTFKGAEVLAKNAEKDAANKMAFLSPGEAQDVLSKLLSIQRDLRSSTTPNSELSAFVAQFSGRLRNSLDNALASDPKFADARDLYKTMMDTLYDPAFDVARRSVGSTGGRKVIKMGEVEGVRALTALEDFAKTVDARAGTSIASNAAAAKQGAIADFAQKYFGTADGLRQIAKKSQDDEVQRTLQEILPDPADRRMVEMMAQAAQIVQRRVGGGAAAAGTDATAAAVGRTVAGAAGSVLARTAAIFTPRFVAHAFTTPRLRQELPRLVRLIQSGQIDTLKVLPKPIQGMIEEAENFQQQGE